MIQVEASGAEFDKELDKLSRDFDPANPTFFFTVDLNKTNMVNWTKMVLEAERDLANAHRQELEEEKEDVAGKQNYLTYLDQLERKYSEGENDQKTDWYDVDDGFIDDTNLKEKNLDAKTKIGGYFVCRGAPEVVPPREDEEEKDEGRNLVTKPKVTTADEVSEPFSPEVQKQLAALSEVAGELDEQALKELLADDPSVAKPKHKVIALGMLKVLNVSTGMKQRKRTRLLKWFKEILPYPGKQPDTLLKMLKTFALSYSAMVPKELLKLKKQLEEAKLEYLFNLLKKEKQVLLRRLKRQVKLDVKLWDTSGKPPGKYRYINFENMLDDLCKVVHVINAEATALRHNRKRITNKEKRQEFFEKIVDVWPAKYKMTLEKFSALWDKHKKPIPSTWKATKGEKSLSSPAISVVSEKVNSSRKEGVQMLTSLPAQPVEDGVSRKRPITISEPGAVTTAPSAKRARCEPIADVVEVVSTIPQSTSFYRKPNADPWADWRFSTKPTGSASLSIVA